MKSLLLLGTSHVGKSTCAKAIGDKYGLKVVSTDSLGRHPGRPWTGVPSEVLEFYSNMSDDAIYWFLRVHHQNMRAVIDAVLKAQKDPFILEGAALRPENLVQSEQSKFVPVCLYVADNVLKERILANAMNAPKDVTLATHRFLERSLRENSALEQSARQHGITCLDVTGMTLSEQVQSIDALFCGTEPGAPTKDGP